MKLSGNPGDHRNRREGPPGAPPAPPPGRPGWGPPGNVEGRRNQATGSWFAVFGPAYRCFAGWAGRVDRPSGIVFLPRVFRSMISPFPAWRVEFPWDQNALFRIARTRFPLAWTRGWLAGGGDWIGESLLPKRAAIRGCGQDVQSRNVDGAGRQRDGTGTFRPAAGPVCNRATLPAGIFVAGPFFFHPRHAGQRGPRVQFAKSPNGNKFGRDRTAWSPTHRRTQPSAPRNADPKRVESPTESVRRELVAGSTWAAGPALLGLRVFRAPTRSVVAEPRRKGSGQVRARKDSTGGGSAQTARFGPDLSGRLVLPESLVGSSGDHGSGKGPNGGGRRGLGGPRRTSPRPGGVSTDDLERTFAEIGGSVSSRIGGGPGGVDVRPIPEWCVRDPRPRRPRW